MAELTKADIKLADAVSGEMMKAAIAEIEKDAAKHEQPTILVALACTMLIQRLAAAHPGAAAAAARDISKLIPRLDEMAKVESQLLTV